MSIVHIWDLFKAKTTGTASVRAKLKAGWQVQKLSIGYSTIVAQYLHALVSPSGEVLQISDGVLAQVTHTVQGVCQVDDQVVILDVAFKDKDMVKARGAVWVSAIKKWCVHPGQKEEFKEFWEKDETGQARIYKLCEVTEEANICK